MASPDDNLAYVRETLDLFDTDDPHRTSKILRRCTRLASLRGDWKALTWLELEAHEFGAYEPASEGLAVELMLELGLDPGDPERTAEAEAFLTRRTFNERSEHAGLVSGQSVELLEQNLKMLDDEIAAVGPQDNDSYEVQLDKIEARTKLQTSRETNRTTLAKTRTALLHYLLRAERELTFISFNETFLARTKRFVDTALEALSPEAVARFNGAYARLQDGDAESLSQAATSCRRVLHAVADAVCPPRPAPAVGRDGKSRDLTADKYRNRLLWFVSETAHASLNRKPQPLLAIDTDLLSARLEALDSLGSKGTHGPITAAEVERLAIQVYLLVAELLQLKEAVDNADAVDAVES